MYLGQKFREGGGRRSKELPPSSNSSRNVGLQAIPAKNTLLSADAERVESAFQRQLSSLASDAAGGRSAKRHHREKKQRRSAVDKTVLSLPTPRRIRDRGHVKAVVGQPCLVCGRRPADAHHLRFAQLIPTLGP
jgi:hypothetical protein